MKEATNRSEPNMSKSNKVQPHRTDMLFVSSSRTSWRNGLVFYLTSWYSSSVPFSMLDWWTILTKEFANVNDTPPSSVLCWYRVVMVAAAVVVAAVTLSHTRTTKLLLRFDPFWLRAHVHAHTRTYTHTYRATRYSVSHTKSTTRGSEERSTNQPTNRPTDQPTNRPTDHER